MVAHTVSDTDRAAMCSAIMRLAQGVRTGTLQELARIQRGHEDERVYWAHVGQYDAIR